MVRGSVGHLKNRELPTIYFTVWLQIEKVGYNIRGIGVIKF